MFKYCKCSNLRITTYSWDPDGSFCPLKLPTRSSASINKFIIFSESSDEQDSAPHTPEPEITWLDKTHVENGSSAVKQPPKFLVSYC